MGTKLKETKSGRIPEEWGAAPLGSLANITTGTKDVNEGNPDGEYPFFTCAKEHTYSDSFSFDCEALLVAGNANVGRTSYYSGKFEAYQRTYVLSAFSNVISRYLKYYLQKNLEFHLQSNIHKSAMSYIKVEYLKNFIVYLPPLPEQRKIAEILSTVDETIEKTDAITHETQQLKKGLMQKLFTEGIGHTQFKQTKIGQIPEEWECRRIGDFVTEYKGGASLTPSDFISMGKKVLPKVGVVPGGILRIPFNKQQYCSEEYANANPKSVVDSQFIIVVLRDLVPSGPSIGLIVRIPNGDEYLLAQGVYGLRMDRESLDETFFIQLSNSSWYRKYMQRILVGSTQVHIRNSEFWNVLIPYPSVEEQRRISQILIEIDTQIENNIDYKTELEKLKKGLMHVLLTGKIRVKTDE